MKPATQAVAPAQLDPPHCCQCSAPPVGGCVVVVVRAVDVLDREVVVLVLDTVDEELDDEPDVVVLRVVDVTRDVEDDEPPP